MKQEPVKFEISHRGKPYEATYSVASGRVLISVRLEEDFWSQACACSNGNHLGTARDLAREILARADEAGVRALSATMQQDRLPASPER